MKKKLLSSLLTLTLVLPLLACTGCGTKKTGEVLTVLNYGKYFDEDKLKQFEKETGIEVKYDEYESPEEMYTKYKSGSIDYDVICTSEYFVQKLIEEGEVKEFDYSSLENYSNVDASIVAMTDTYDPEHKFCLPYFYGTLGLLYNTKYVSEEDASSWDCLWDDKFAGNIIMQDSVRDSFSPALISLGYSINTTNKEEINKAYEILAEQAKNIYGYYVDEAGDLMIGEEAYIALVYSGEAAYAMDNCDGDFLAYSVPKEGSNFWVDSWFIPKTCKNDSAAAKFLDYVCRDDVAQANFEYIYYASPILSVCEAQDEDTKKNEAINPSKESLDRCELYVSLSDELTVFYSEIWSKLLASQN